MSFLFKWIKKCITYYFSGTDQLINKINDQKTAIHPDVKHELVMSIMDNKPDQFVAQINDQKNMIPEQIKAELMAMVSSCPKPAPIKVVEAPAQAPVIQVAPAHRAETILIPHPKYSPPIDHAVSYEFKFKHKKQARPAYQANKNYNILKREHKCNQC